MRFIVDEMPKAPEECPYSEWKPYPPIVRETGYYMCKLGKDDCVFRKDGCRYLRAQEADHDEKGA